MSSVVFAHLKKYNAFQHTVYANEFMVMITFMVLGKLSVKWGLPIFTSFSNSVLSQQKTAKVNVSLKLI